MSKIVSEREKSLSNVVKIDEKEIRNHLSEMVRLTVEETLNRMLAKLMFSGELNSMSVLLTELISVGIIIKEIFIRKKLENWKLAKLGTG